MPWTGTLSDRFGRVKWKCKNRGFEFLITKEQWAQLILNPCHYCGISLKSIKRGSGLDRIDNSKGYILDNIVPCCYECNMIKGNFLTYEEAKVVLTALKEYRASKVDF